MKSNEKLTTGALRTKATICNGCRKPVCYGAAEGGREVPCPFCGDPVYLKPLEGFTVEKVPGGRRLAVLAAALATVSALAAAAWVLKPKSAAVSALIGRCVAPEQAVAPAEARVSGSGIRVAVTDVRMDRPLLRYPALGSECRAERPVLCLRLRLTNPGKEDTGYRTWRQGGAVLRSRLGALSPCSYGQYIHPAGIVPAETLAAGSVAEDMIFFICEAAPDDDLLLELDGSNCGGRGSLGIKIPKTALVR